jgi:hypothetical protein
MTWFWLVVGSAPTIQAEGQQNTFRPSLHKQWPHHVLMGTWTYLCLAQHCALTTGASGGEFGSRSANIVFVLPGLVATHRPMPDSRLPMSAVAHIHDLFCFADLSSQGQCRWNPIGARCSGWAAGFPCNKVLDFICVYCHRSNTLGGWALVDCFADIVLTTRCGIHLVYTWSACCSHVKSLHTVNEHQHNETNTFHGRLQVLVPAN